MINFEKAFELACQTLADSTGSCPKEVYGYEPYILCEDHCSAEERDPAVCWKRYFVNHCLESEKYIDATLACKDCVKKGKNRKHGRAKVVK